MRGAERLYTPELLGLAVSLADYRPDAALPLHGTARSRSCGSTLEIDVALDAAGKVEKLGMQVRACAIGQAAAAIFARAATGRGDADLRAAHAVLEAWLAEGGDPPDWPGIELLAEAREFPARHGAIMLPWKAALGALSSAGREG